MYLRDLARSLARRWYFVLAGLIVTGLLCVTAYRVIPVTYDSQASMVLLPPETSTKLEGNPFLLLGGLSGAVDILTRTINSDADAKPLLKAHPGAKFEVVADTSTSGPIILITSTAPTAQRAKAMTRSVIAAVPVALEQIQSGLTVAADAQIRVIPVAVDSGGTLNAKTRTQAVLAVGAVGAVITVLLTGFIDGLVRGRKRRRDDLAEKADLEETEEVELDVDQLDDSDTTAGVGSIPDDTLTTRTPSRGLKTSGPVPAKRR